VAIRAALSVLVPLVVLDLTGHLAWTMYAAFGAFASLYGRDRVDARRVELQLVAAGWQVGAVTLGALVAASDHRNWLAVPLAAAVAVAAAYRSAVEGWHPPGSLFQVFGIAAVASVPGTVRDVVPALVVSAVSALFSVAVGGAGAMARRVRRTVLLEDSAPIGGSTVGAWRYALQAGAGVLVAGAVANGLGIGRPYWAMVSAVVPLAARALPMQVVRAIHRLVGTGLGLLVSWAVLAQGPHGMVAIVAVVVMQALAELTVGRNYALALAFITPLALLMGDVVRPVPTGTLVWDRGAETCIGVAVGMAVGWVSRARPRPAS
jgi:hypothetical protein